MKEESEKIVWNSTFKTLRSWRPAPSHHGKEQGRKWLQWRILFSWAPKSLWTVSAVAKLRCLLLRKKLMTNLDGILKSRGITLLTKICIVKAMVFPVIMFRCESWTVKKGENQRFELWSWRSLLRVPWTAKRSNQSISKEINPEYSLEGLKLKLQYFGHMMWRGDALEKTLILRKIEGRRRRGRPRIRWLDSTTASMNVNLSKLWEIVKDREACSVAVHGVAKSQTWLIDETVTTAKRLDL